jgi:hypothetical protein
LKKPRCGSFFSKTKFFERKISRDFQLEHGSQKIENMNCAAKYMSEMTFQAKNHFCRLFLRLEMQKKRGANSPALFYWSEKPVSRNATNL